MKSIRDDKVIVFIEDVKQVNLSSKRFTLS